MRTEASHKIATQVTARGTFAANYDGDASEHFYKSMQMHRIAVDTGLFIVPKPLAFSELGDVIEWELLDDLRPIRTALPQLTEGDQTSVAERLGMTLAAIHANLQMEGTFFSADHAVTRIRNDGLRNHVRRVIERSETRNVHGDFACANIFLNSENRVVTLDPEPNTYLFHAARPSIRTSIYFELALLIQSLASRRDFYQAMGQRLDPVSGLFIDGYERQLNVHLDRRAVFGLAAGIMLVYRHYRSRDGTETWYDRFRAARFRKRAASRLQCIALQESICDA